MFYKPATLPNFTHYGVVRLSNTILCCNALIKLPKSFQQKNISDLPAGEEFLGIQLVKYCITAIPILSVCCTIDYAYLWMIMDDVSVPRNRVIHSLTLSVGELDVND